MTEERLLRWVRGELSARERLDVAEWLVRCSDPRLPEVLSGMIRAVEEERADALLRAKPLGAALASAWSRLWEEARALFDSPAGPLLASVGPPFKWEWREGELWALWLDDTPVRFVLSDDSGEIVDLGEPDDVGDMRLGASAGSRATLWALPLSAEEAPLSARLEAALFAARLPIAEDE